MYDLSKAHWDLANCEMFSGKYRRVTANIFDLAMLLQSIDSNILSWCTLVNTKQTISLKLGTEAILRSVSQSQASDCTFWWSLILDWLKTVSRY